MAKAEIIAHIENGLYTIKRIYAGRDEMTAKIARLNSAKSELQTVYDAMAEETEEEIIKKNIVLLQITELTKQVSYLQDNFPADEEEETYCGDYTTDLTGEVGTIDIPGEMNNNVHVRPGYDGNAVYNAERDGQFYPNIALGHWTSLLHRMIYPGWQRFLPLHRYGYIVEIDYGNDSCALTILPQFSSMQNLDVNMGDGGFGMDIIEEEREIEYYKQGASEGHPGWQDFKERNPSNPLSQTEELAPPIELTPEQYERIDQINSYVDYIYSYTSDTNTWEVGDHWQPMYDLGDGWVDQPISFPKWPDWVVRGPSQKRGGDCEDYVLTKMQMIVEEGIVPAENLQVITCYVNTGDGGGGYHAVLGLQTTNLGFLIMDQINYGVIHEIDDLKRTHRFDAFSVAGSVWAKVQRLKADVPIEYMGCNSSAFAAGDTVIVEFTGQDWTQPKVIGFRAFPRSCVQANFFPDGLWSPDSFELKSNFVYNPGADVWSWHGTYPTNPTRWAACCGAGGIGFRIGGYIDGAVFDYKDDHFIYDSVDETWESARGSGIDCARSQYKFIDAGRAILCGGQASWDGPSLSFARRYEISSDVWESKVSPGSRYDHTSFVIDSQMYIAGGWIDDATDDVRSYNNELDTWISKNDLPYRFNIPKGFSMNGKGYIGGGMRMDYYESLPGIPTETEYFTRGGIEYSINYASICGNDELFNLFGVFYGDYPQSTFINTGVGLYYDPSADVWYQGQCHPSYSWAIGEWANSEIENKTKGIRLGGSQWGNSQYSIVDGLTDTWSTHGSMWGFSEAEHRGFSSGSLGAEI